MAAPLSKDQDIKMLVSMLFDKHGKIALSPKELAAVLGDRTEAGLKQDRDEGVGIPYTRINGKEKGKPLYTLTAIAKTLIDNEVKVF